MLDKIFADKETPIAKDLKLNLSRLLTEGALAPEEAAQTFLAVATAVDGTSLKEAARAELERLSVPAEQAREAEESAAMMGMLNTYYRFRHMLGNDQDYRNAGLRMTALAKPALGKERFEMLAFAVSVVNGCEQCIRSHEKALRDAGVGIEKIHDLARLAAVVKGLKYLGTS